MSAVLHVQMQHDAGAPEELKASFLKLSDEHIRGLTETPNVDDIYQYVTGHHHPLPTLYTIYTTPYPSSTYQYVRLPASRINPA